MVERLVPIDTPLTCTTVGLPREGRPAGTEDDQSAKPVK